MEKFFACQESLSTEVRCPHPHAKGSPTLNVACRRVVVPHTTPIPRARFLQMRQPESEELYMVPPTFRQGAYHVLDNSLASWAATVPARQIPNAYRYALCRVMSTSQQPFTSPPPLDSVIIMRLIACAVHMLGEANLNLPIISLRTITLLHLSSRPLQLSLIGPIAMSFIISMWHPLCIRHAWTLSKRVR